MCQKLCEGWKHDLNRMRSLLLLTKVNSADNTSVFTGKILNVVTSLMMWIVSLQLHYETYEGKKEPSVFFASRVKLGYTVPSLRGGRREEGERGVDGWMDGWMDGGCAEGEDSSSWREGWCWMNSSSAHKVIREALRSVRAPWTSPAPRPPDPRWLSTRPPDTPPWRGKTCGPSPSSSAPSPTWSSAPRSSTRWSPRRRRPSGRGWAWRKTTCSEPSTCPRRTSTSWRRWCCSWSRTKPACSGNLPARFTSQSLWSRP